MTTRLPPPWSVEEQDACYVVRDHHGQQLAYVYFEDEPGRGSADKSELLRRLADLECASRMDTVLKAIAPIVAGSEADNFFERLDAMALIAETHSIRDFRQ